MITKRRRASAHEAGLAKIHDLDPALELMFFGWRGMTEKADAYLATMGLSRVHHRIMFVIARKPDVTVGSLQDILGISKQALHRPLKHLLEQVLVVSERDAEQHRYKILRLTGEGKRIEHRASELERRVMEKAFAKVGASGASAWMRVMASIADTT
ncbi:MAG TPA: MarR family winged helix-turn-helix transcriptional regulator [Afipia sp.]